MSGGLTVSCNSGYTIYPSSISINKFKSQLKIHLNNMSQQTQFTHAQKDESANHTNISENKYGHKEISIHQKNYEPMKGIGHLQFSEF